MPFAAPPPSPPETEKKTKPPQVADVPSAPLPHILIPAPPTLIHLVLLVRGPIRPHSPQLLYLRSQFLSRKNPSNNMRGQQQQTDSPLLEKESVGVGIGKIDDDEESPRPTTTTTTLPVVHIHVLFFFIIELLPLATPLEQEMYACST